MSFPITKCVRPCNRASNPTLQNVGTITKPTTITMKPQFPNEWSSSSSPSLPKLSHRWEYYQGVDNWKGLLDPLDDTLRREIIRYGNFVEAAYCSCNFDPSSSSYASCRFPKSKILSQPGFPATGYRVTKNLTATSGIHLPGWAPTWMSMQSSWIGYIAVCQDRREIDRLGRRDVVIALRGTATGLEWLENMRATLTPLPNDDDKPMVESGFLSLYTSASGNKPSLQTLVREGVSKIMQKYGGERLSLTITGHSLGAALATLAAYDVKKTFKNAPLVTVISFAGPRVGNWSFRCRLEEQGTKVLRIVNSDDVVTKVPGFVVDGNECSAGWVRKVVEDMQWVYADVGCELRLSSRDAPGLNGINIAACHELKTYLRLVDGFVSSNCPFRATARKMMNKTLVR
ncbi:Dolichyl-diphosphooligosaccharide-protein glycosyltransferase subunit dad1 [Salvia divinorum]|uniref:Dolichyl-diphosphooligosaccharide-protein glycosyltransferase subunit dad1 n=1 Tax=Salvia divinorum TaxID=28513 RepID=A0ABD1GH30_SALDI